MPWALWAGRCWAFGRPVVGRGHFLPGFWHRSLIGIALVGLGGGLGLHAARRWQTRRQDKAADERSSAMAFVNP